MKMGIIKRALATILVFSIALCFCGCFGGNSNKVNSFYETVSESQGLLDSVADVKSDKNNGALIKEIMSVYSKYYEFVVNVSGSFDNYSANQEN